MYETVASSYIIILSFQIIVSAGECARQWHHLTLSNYLVNLYFQQRNVRDSGIILSYQIIFSNHIFSRETCETVASWGAVTAAQTVAVSLLSRPGRDLSGHHHHQWFIIIIIITIITITINLMMMIRTHGIWFLPSLTEEEATSILHSKEPGVRHLYLMKWFINENQIFSELPGAKIPHHPFLPLGQAWIVSWICCPSL